MNFPNALFEAPSLLNTDSPTIVTHEEYLKRKSYVAAFYALLEGDQVRFDYEVDGKNVLHSNKRVNGTQAALGRVTDLIADHSHWDLLGVKTVAHFTATRDGIELGRSEMFNFEILDK